MKRWARTIATILIGLSTAMGAYADQLAQKKELTLSIVKKLVAAAENEACKTKCNVGIAVLDDGGNLIYVERMDDAHVSSPEFAIEKARSAALYQVPTKTFQDRLAKGETKVLKMPNVMISAGGVPLVADGKVIGAIGVAGGADEAAAQAAVDALAKLIVP